MYTIDIVSHELRIKMMASMYITHCQYTRVRMPLNNKKVCVNTLMYHCVVHITYA